MEQEILSMIKAYLGDDYSESQDDIVLLLIRLNIDEFKTYMNYPSGFNEEKINSDLSRYKTCLFRCVLYDYNMQGFEDQKSHSESGVSVSFEDKAMIYARSGAVPYAEI